MMIPIAMIVIRRRVNNVAGPVDDCSSICITRAFIGPMRPPLNCRRRASRPVELIGRSAGPLYDPLGMEPIPQGFEHTDCPGCESPDSQLALVGRDWTLDPQRQLFVVRCVACGLHFTNPRPTAAKLADYYQADYAPHHRQRGEIQRTSPRSTAVRTWVLADAAGAPALRPRGWRRALVRIIRIVLPPEHFGFTVPFFGEGRLLDFGCGDGTFLRRMAAIGWNCTGLDFSQRAVDAVRAGGVPALKGTLPHPQLVPASFDLISMRHALEHVPDPRPVLTAALPLLRPGGRLLIQVPNFASWEIAHFGDAAFSLDLPRQLLHFTPSTLANLLRSCGFELLQLDQRCRTAALRKSLSRARQSGRHHPFDFLLKIKPLCALAAARARRRGQDNEIIATAIKP
jgi:2-polyprenyl-3-methyl-5-hydroxy-6-metoxy-1,4-benzoquinol methylase